MNINLVQVCGRITKKLEVRSTQGGSKVCSFSVATNRTWKNEQGEKQEETEFHNIVAWGKAAETIAQWFDKGDEIYIMGRLRTSSWEKDGIKKYRTDIVMERFEFGQKAKANQRPKVEDEPAEDYGEPPQNNDEEEVNLDDIPF